MHFELFGKETALMTDEITLSYKELENCIQMIDPAEMSSVFATNKSWEEIPLLFCPLPPPKNRLPDQSQVPAAPHPSRKYAAGPCHLHPHLGKLRDPQTGLP